MFVLLFESNDVLLHIEFIARLRADSDSGEVHQTIQFYSGCLNSYCYRHHVGQTFRIVRFIVVIRYLAQTSDRNSLRIGCIRVRLGIDLDVAPDILSNRQDQNR